MENFALSSPLDYELPDFSEITPEGIREGLTQGIKQWQSDIDTIVNNPHPATWENTFIAWEQSGAQLWRALTILENFSGVLATPEIVSLEEEFAPALSRTLDSVWLNKNLWLRLKDIDIPQEGTEEFYLYTKIMNKFSREGVELAEQDKLLLLNLNTQSATLLQRFGHELAQAMDQAKVYFDREEQLAGVSETTKASMAQRAQQLGVEGWVYDIELPTVQSILASLENPLSRKKVYTASVERGAGTQLDSIAIEIAQLRARRAEILEYASHADYVVEGETAGDMQAVQSMLEDILAPTVNKARTEHARLVRLAQENGQEFTAADWPFWSKRIKHSAVENVDTVSSVKQDLIENIEEYFPLSQVQQGAFYAAQRLYGVDVIQRPDLKGYHPDVDVWEVIDSEGYGIGLLLTDMYARGTKRGGAWTNSFVQQNMLNSQAPVVVNVLNIAKPPEGEEALLSVDEVKTVFHEFGHALHGLLSEVKYPSLSGTNVPRDFVEFPSQLNENWAQEPEVMQHYARHYRTGEILSAAQQRVLVAQQQDGQAFETLEYLLACLLDIMWHTRNVQEAENISSVSELEKKFLTELGLADFPVKPRYLSNYFQHIFAGGYSAAYWSYLWAEVLDADAFEAFKDVDAAVGYLAPVSSSTSCSVDVGQEKLDADDVRFAGERFVRLILSRGAALDYEEAFRMFRGKERNVEPLLRRYGIRAE